jgi:hypothetical protein
MWTNNVAGCAGIRSMPTTGRSDSASPEPVLSSPGQERVPGAWLSHESPEASVMMQIPGVGPFVRALLAVRLMGGMRRDLRRLGRHSSR